MAWDELTAKAISESDENGILGNESNRPIGERKEREMRHLYLFDMGLAKDDCCYITRTQQSTHGEPMMSLLELSEANYRSYLDGTVFTTDRENTIKGITDLSGVVRMISVIRRIPSILLVESEDISDDITSFKVIRHIPIKEVDQYMDHYRVELWNMKQESDDCNVYKIVTDYDFLRSGLEEDYYTTYDLMVPVVGIKEKSV